MELGFRLSVARHLSLRFDYGWSLGKFDGVKENSRGHFSLNLSY
jgi:hemolysin activation/secretion protein